MLSLVQTADFWLLAQLQTSDQNEHSTQERGTFTYVISYQLQDWAYYVCAPKSSHQVPILVPDSSKSWESHKGVLQKQICYLKIWLIINMV